MTRSWRLRMADPRGFLRYERTGPRRRPVESRVRDWREVYLPFGREELTEQAARCMSCGIAFCHEGCPLGNLIPEWNDLVERGRFAEASDRLHATNNFPEFTGRLCPAPCEGSCVLGITSEPVLIKQVELETAEWAASSGVLVPHGCVTQNHPSHRPRNHLRLRPSQQPHLHHSSRRRRNPQNRRQLWIRWH